MSDDFVQYMVSILLNKNGTRRKRPERLADCCLDLDGHGRLLITSGEKLVYVLHYATAYPKACGISIEGLEKIYVNGQDAYRRQELWCYKDDLNRGRMK